MNVVKQNGHNGTYVTKGTIFIQYLNETTMIHVTKDINHQHSTPPWRSDLQLWPTHVLTLCTWESTLYKEHQWYSFSNGECFLFCNKPNRFISVNCILDLYLYLLLTLAKNYMQIWLLNYTDTNPHTENIISVYNTVHTMKKKPRR